MNSYIHMKKLPTFTLAIFLIVLAHATFSVADDYFDYFFPNERARIKEFSSHAKRDGDTLYLSMKSGADVGLADSKDCEASPDTCKGYQFLNYFETKGFYLVYVRHYEGFDYIMVSDETGDIQSISDFPQFSPDNERFVVVSADETGYGTNGVFIWRLENGGLASELSYEPEEYALYGFVAWEGDKTILLSKLTDSDKALCPASDFMRVPVTLKREGDGWRFHKDLSVEAVTCDVE